MERVLNWLDRKLGRHVPHGLYVWLIGLWAVVFIGLYLKPDAVGDFTLERAGLLHGEVYRLVTFLLLPPSLGRGQLDLILGAVTILFFFTVLSSLEAEWGPTRLWAYYLIGALGTIGGALVTGRADNVYLNLSLLLAFGTVFPDYQIMLFFILPVKMKWLAMLDGVFLLYAFATRGSSTRAAIAMALLNFTLFFAAQLFDKVRGKVSARKQGGGGGQKGRLEEFREMSLMPKRRSRICARCGKSENDDPTLEFRVCDCEKCGGKATDYCLEHARAH